MIRIRNASMLGLLAAVAAATAQTPLPPGTEVYLRFDQSLSSRTAHAGDAVKLEVAHNVVFRGRTVLRSGTPVSGVIERVSKKDRFGKNAQIRLALMPVHGISLAPRDKGAMFGGSRTTEAAGAAGAGALVFGPLGLAAGYFVVGKSVNVHVGDRLRTEVQPHS